MRIFAKQLNVKIMKKLPKELHKKRVLLFIEPDIIEAIGKEKCKEVSKIAINKEFKKSKKL